MPRGHNFTHCQICGKEYICGDCITSDCELGGDKRKCEHYQAHIRQERAQACRLIEMARDASRDKKQRGMGRLLAGHAWDNICKELEDGELAEALKHKIWSNMELGTEEIALMEQAIDRLSGIKS